jgi:hypothetical protein
MLCSLALSTAEFADLRIATCTVQFVLQQQICLCNKHLLSIISERQGKLSMKIRKYTLREYCLHYFP